MLYRFMIAAALLTSASAASAGSCRGDLENRCRTDCNASAYSSAKRGGNMNVYTCYESCRYQYGCQRN